MMADRYNYGPSGEYLGKSSDTPPGSGGGGCGCLVLGVIAFAIFSGSGSNNSSGTGSASPTSHQESNHEWEIIKNFSKKFSKDEDKQKQENVEDKK
jgi:hypothetical protein